MLEVFVETNWVVGWAAPLQHASPEAVALLEEAARGELRLHLPAICVTEARATIRRKFQPTQADAVRKFLRPSPKHVTSSDRTAALRVLDQFESATRDHLAHLDDRLASIVAQPNVRVFPLSELSLAKQVALATEPLELRPFDQAVLAAVLTEGWALAATGAPVSFCTLDSDLQPWPKKGHLPKQPLTSLYDEARIWVHGDFARSVRPRPDRWPPTSAERPG